MDTERIQLFCPGGDQSYFFSMWGPNLNFKKCQRKYNKIIKCSIFSLYFQDKINFGIVEYTHGNVYYRILQKETITNCLKPTGKIYYPSLYKLAFTITRKGNQKVNKSYLTFEMCGEIQSGIIKIYQLSVSIDEQISELKNYVNRKL